MKNIFKYMFVAAAGVLLAASCQELEDFHTTIDAPDVLVYTNEGGLENIHTIRIAHAPVGSFGSYEAVFPLLCNSGTHAAAQLTFAYDEAAAQAYADEHSTAKKSYKVLPASYLQLEKYVKDAAEGAAPAAPVLTLEENARQSSDSLRVSLTGDLSQLTERAYIAALSVDGGSVAGTSEMLGTYYVEVLTEINCIRPLSSKDDVVGMELDHFEHSSEDGLYTIDLGETRLVTGMSFTYSYSYWSGGSLTISDIEYSVDGETWEQAGTPQEGDYIEESPNWSSRKKYLAFYGFIKGRYVRFNYEGSLQNVSVYFVENEQPTLYFDYNSSNTANALIKHMPSGSASDLSLSFAVKVAPSVSSNITGTVAVDNSLIEAYNTANGTRFEAMPEGNINLQNGSFIIGSGAVKSSEIQISLTGDLSALKSANGYLLPLSISSSATVSDNLGVLYVIVETMEQMLKTNPTGDDLAGLSKVEDRSGWSASNADGDDLSGFAFGQSSWDAIEDNPVFYDLGKEYEIGAVALCSMYSQYGDYYMIRGVTLAYSLDGSSYVGIGVAESSDLMWYDGLTVAVIDGTVKARYIRVSDCKAMYFYGLNNFNVYVK